MATGEGAARALDSLGVGLTGGGRRSAFCTSSRNCAREKASLRRHEKAPASVSTLTANSTVAKPVNRMAAQPGSERRTASSTCKPSRLWGSLPSSDRSRTAMRWARARMRGRACSRVEAVSTCKPGVAEQFAENALPGAVIFHNQCHQRSVTHERSPSARGKRNRKAAPRARLLSTSTDPPSRVVRVFTHHKPKPSLPRGLPGRAEKLKSKMRSCSSGGMPGPSSMTRVSTHCPDRRPSMRIKPPSGMASAALMSRLTNTRVRVR